MKNIRLVRKNSVVQQIKKILRENNNSLWLGELVRKLRTATNSPNLAYTSVAYWVSGKYINGKLYGGWLLEDSQVKIENYGKETRLKLIKLDDGDIYDPFEEDSEIDTNDSSKGVLFSNL